MTAITNAERFTVFPGSLVLVEALALIALFDTAALRFLSAAAALHPTTMHSPASAAQSLWYFEPHPGHLNDVALPISLRHRGQLLEAMAGISFQLSAPGGARSVAP
jgi:hypothetical protein